MTDKAKAQKKEMIIKLLPKKNYHIGKVCKEVGIGRRTFYSWREGDEEFDQRCEEVFEYDIDDSEEKMKLLRQGIPKFNEEGKFVGWHEKPHFGALVKHLESKAKDRGWGNSIEINDSRNKEIRSMTDEELFKKISDMSGKVNIEKWDSSKDGQEGTD